MPQQEGTNEEAQSGKAFLKQKIVTAYRAGGFAKRSIFLATADEEEVATPKAASAVLASAQRRTSIWRDCSDDPNTLGSDEDVSDLMRELEECEAQLLEEQQHLGGEMRNLHGQQEQSLAQLKQQLGTGRDGDGITVPIPPNQVAMTVQAVTEQNRTQANVMDKLLKQKDEMLLLTLKREKTTKAVLRRKVLNLEGEAEKAHTHLLELMGMVEESGVNNGQSLRVIDGSYITTPTKEGETDSQPDRETDSRKASLSQMGDIRTSFNRYLGDLSSLQTELSRINFDTLRRSHYMLKENIADMRECLVHLRKEAIMMKEQTTHSLSQSQGLLLHRIGLALGDTTVPTPPETPEDAPLHPRLPPPLRRTFTDAETNTIADTITIADTDGRPNSTGAAGGGGILRPLLVDAFAQTTTDAESPEDLQGVLSSGKLTGQLRQKVLGVIKNEVNKSRKRMQNQPGDADSDKPGTAPHGLNEAPGETNCQGAVRVPETPPQGRARTPPAEVPLEEPCAGVAQATDSPAQPSLQPREAESRGPLSEEGGLEGTYSVIISRPPSARSAFTDHEHPEESLEEVVPKDQAFSEATPSSPASPQGEWTIELSNNDLIVSTDKREPRPSSVPAKPPLRGAASVLVNKLGAVDVDCLLLPQQPHRFKVYCYKCGCGPHRDIGQCPACGSSLHYGIGIGEEKRRKVREEIVKEWRLWLEKKRECITGSQRNVKKRLRALEAFVWESEGLEGLVETANQGAPDAADYHLSASLQPKRPKGTQKLTPRPPEAPRGLPTVGGFPLSTELVKNMKSQDTGTCWRSSTQPRRRPPRALPSKCLATRPTEPEREGKEVPTFSQHVRNVKTRRHKQEESDSTLPNLSLGPMRAVFPHDSSS